MHMNERLDLTLDLSRNDLWQLDWFHQMLIGGLCREGLSASAAEQLKALLTESRPRSFEQFVKEVRKKNSNLSESIKLEIEKHIFNLERTVDFNNKCYLRDTPEKTRVTQWPNNQTSRQNNPRHYFDIYEDLFFRERYPILKKNTPIGSAGSCFALRIAHQLQYWGYNYIIEEDDLPPDFPIENITDTGYRMAPARIGTLFNVPSMRQMVERAFGLWEPERVVTKVNSRFIDPFRSTKALYTDYQGFVDDYHNHTAALRRALLSCEVFILTLGLTEAWQFAHSGAYTSIAPFQIDPVLLRHRELSVDENVLELERLFEIYRSHRPGIKLIISVSPIPLNKTFSTTQHVVTANSLSKATLRVASDIFVRNHPNDVFYFPSYETITYGMQHPWEKDMRHVSSEAVQKVMRLFAAMFIADQTEFEYLSHKEPSHPSPTVMQLAKRYLRPIKRIFNADL